MKSIHRNFPDSLLQQYNFDTNTTGALAEASEEATATDEPEPEAAAKPQAEVESKDAEPSDQLEEECDKSATDSSPTKAEDDSEKEREEPSVKTPSKTRLFMGILFIIGREAHILIDPGFMHPFVSCSFAIYLGREPEPLDCGLVDHTPTRESLLDESVY